MLALLVAAVSVATLAGQVEPLNRVVAVANKEVITQAQLDMAMANTKHAIASAHQPVPADSLLRPQVLDELIMQTLQLQLAKHNGVTVSDAELAKGIARMAAENKLTVKALLAKVTVSGESASQFRKEIKKQMLIAKVQQAAVGPMVKVSDDMVQKTLQQEKKVAAASQEYHLADILIAVPAKATKAQWENTEGRAGAVYKKLTKGADFSKVARMESGSSTALKGGDMGWVRADNLPDLFTEKLIGLKVGQMTTPIHADNGYHILKLLGTKAGHSTLTKAEAQQIVYRQAFQKALVKWLKTLKKNAYIKVMT